MTTVEDRKALVQEVLDAYPAKAQKTRSKHLNIKKKALLTAALSPTKNPSPA
jgi:nitrogenase molybdenum-iron protein alpha chain